VTLAVLVACCASLVPRYGGDGAALALVVASSVHALLSWMALRNPAKFSPACRSIVLPSENQ
jgi:peptidoglycan biosynthesis protein MviN/MurJ (putative lipid II flippase)